MKNRICLITGASSGFGEATARVFAAAGYKLILAARRLSRLQELSAELKEKHGTDCLCLELDVRKYEDVAVTLGSLPADYAAVDVLINNAGLALGADNLAEANVEHWQQMIDTNISGLLYVSRSVLKGMLERKSGLIIHMGSISGKDHYAKGSVYCATKAAVDAITECLRRELLGTGVIVTVLRPGAAETEFSKVRFSGDEQKAASVYQGLPNPLSAQDIAEAALWIASRPKNVCISEMNIVSVDQAANGLFNRVN